MEDDEIFSHFSISKFLFRYLFQASGYSAYIGPFTSEFRKKAVDCWMQKMESLKVSHNPVFSLAEILGDQVAIRNWRISGLPGKFHLSLIQSRENFFEKKVFVPYLSVPY